MSAVSRAFAPRRQEGPVPDKSPQRPAGKKAGKSLKEKREAKRLKKDGPKPGLPTR